MIKANEKNKIVEQFKAYLKAHNMRCTPTRLRILDFCTIINPPILFKDLAERAKKERICTQTIYDTINLLVDADIIQRITLQGKIKEAYSLTTDTRNKAKIICTRCGRVAEFKDLTITDRLLSHRYNNFNMAYYTVTVYGHCKVCRKLLGETIKDGWSDDHRK